MFSISRRGNVFIFISSSFSTNSPAISRSRALGNTVSNVVQQGGRQAFTAKSFPLGPRPSHLLMCGTFFLFFSFLFLHSSCHSTYEILSPEWSTDDDVSQNGVWRDALGLVFSRNRDRTNRNDLYLHSIQMRMVLGSHLQYIGSSENVTRSLLRASHAKLHRQSPKMRTWQAPQSLTSSWRSTVCALYLS